MPGLGVVFNGEGEEGCARWSAKLEDSLVGVAVEASPSAWHDGGVFDPDLEAAVCANGGYEVGMYGWRKPMDLV